MSERPIIALRDLHKAFGPKQVLKGLNLDVPRGRSLVIIGASGMGKSVLLKCILGLIKPEQGRIIIDGADASAFKPKVRRQVMEHFGMLFQGAALFDSLPVWENVAFRLLKVARMGRRKARELAIEALGQVNLSPQTANLYPNDLSGGMKKRVGLARAIVAKPDILFFDEPTTGLDPITADVINDLIVERVKALGATAVTITHDIASMRKIADDVAMIHGGKIIWRGPIDQLDASGNAYVEQFIHGRAHGPIEVGGRRAS
ncbi:MAG: ABC transporter ATP-binding protein [Maricaulaceae bacterium]